MAIAMAEGGIMNAAETLPDRLAEAEPAIRSLCEQLDEGDVRDVFDATWRAESQIYMPLFENRGVDPSELADDLWAWLSTGKIPGSPPETEFPLTEAAFLREQAPARPILFPDLSRSEYLFVETVRALLPPEQDTFPEVEALAERLIARRGCGFGGAAFDDRGQLISPPWVAAQSAAVDPSRGRVSIGASVSHMAFDLPPALDLGARDGHNLTGWRGPAPQGMFLPHNHLFLGNLMDGWLEMEPVGGSIYAHDVSPDGSELAVLEKWAADFLVWLIDAETGERRLITILDGLLGDERIRFSPDGEWLLVASWSRPILMRTEDGANLILPLEGPTAWWPARSTSSLMVLDQTNLGYPRLAAFDLATGEAADLGTINLPRQPGLPDERHLLSAPEVEPAGDRVLSLTKNGPPPAHQLKHGSRDRVCVIHLGTREVELTEPPFLDGAMVLEREHRAPRWLASPLEGPAVVHPSLMASLRPAQTELSYEHYESVGEDTRQLAVLGLNAMVGDDPGSSDPQRLLPEVLRAMVALQQFAPDQLERIESWVDQVADMYGEGVRLGALSPEATDGWTKFNEAWQLIKDGDPDSIPWHRYRFLS